METKCYKHFGIQVDRGKIKTDQTSAGLKQYQNSKGLIFQSVVWEKRMKN